ncbi:Yip1 protein [Rhizoctonia solani]|uniref:Yip1 protein n=1 Tax=Rhizoctonia solani TaxID=456999 RepID=A0A8H7IE53_9AGAM|nr:Yip1 protein [Rhizoctonia solani]
MALFDQQTQYAGGYYAQQPDLQFYSGSPGVDPSAAFYPGARPSLEGNVVAGVGPGSGHPILAEAYSLQEDGSALDEHIMDDADLAGPLIILLCLATCLLMSGRPQFGYIYGVAVFGAGSLYTLLNLMSNPVSTLTVCKRPWILPPSYGWRWRP